MSRYKGRRMMPPGADPDTIRLLGVRIPPDLDEHLRTVAHAQGIAVGTLIRHAIEHTYKRNDHARRPASL